MSKIAQFTMAVAFAALWVAVSAYAGPGQAPGKGEERGRLSVSKTVEARWKRERRYAWTLEKLAAPASLELGRGREAEVIFSLTANRGVASQTDTISVAGRVCVTNDSRAPTRGLKIVDELQQRRGSEWITIPGGQSELAGVEDLGPFETRCFPYGFPSAALSHRYDYRNRALVVAEGLSAEAAVEFDVPTEPELVEIDKVVALQDELHCPQGMSCATPWPQLPLLLDHSQSLAYRTLIHNFSAPSGCVEDAHNVARLIGVDTRTEVKATAKALIATGGRKGS